MWYYVYVLRCADGQLYSNVTEDLAAALNDHKNGRASPFTRAHGADKIVYRQRFITRKLARKHLARIKAMRREEKLAFIRLR
jgi:putative endonuclease